MQNRKSENQQMNSTNKIKFRKVIRPAVYMILILYIVLSAISFDRSFNALSDKINSYGDEEFEFVCKISDYPIPDEDEIKVYADILSTNHPENLKGQAHPRMFCCGGRRCRQSKNRKRNQDYAKLLRRL